MSPMKAVFFSPYDETEFLSVGPGSVGAVWMHMQIEVTTWDMRWGSCLTSVTLSLCLVYSCNQQQIQVLMGPKTCNV